ncbi:MAG: ATP-binding protein [Bradymonadales bacterium]|nr:MAG: ATP-binding protein [Bradymonadales bacterium]
MLLKRSSYLAKAKEILRDRPVLAILGPRQCGKTTFVKEFLSEKFDYLDLERPSDLNLLLTEPELYLKEQQRPLVIDEAQRLPELFPLLRSESDRRKKKGQFVLLGSSSFQLIEAISESLAGRVGFLDLNPLGLFEINESGIDWKGHWLKGGFPDALLQGRSKKINFNWFEDYTRTLVERDLPSLGISITPHQFRKLWAMASHFHGQVLNMNKLANSLDLSPHTVKRYLDILEQTFMIRRLQPFSGNLKKRLVKSPKLYIRDSGLFHYFQRILTERDLISHPSRGASFEGYTIEQLLQVLRLKTPEYESLYFRSSDEVEVDLILQKGGQLSPIEIKASLSPSKDQCKSLYKFLELSKCKRAFVLGMGSQRFWIDKRIEFIGIESWAQDSFPAFWDEKS